MTQKEIEEAAVDSCVFENSIFNPELTPYYEQGFKDGANWRINSVWNDNNVIPGYDCKILIEDIYGGIYEDKYDADFNEYGSGIEKKEIKRWAYVKDLLPSKED